MAAGVLFPRVRYMRQISLAHEIHKFETGRGVAAVACIAGELRIVAQVLARASAVRANPADMAEPGDADAFSWTMVVNADADSLDAADDLMAGNEILTRIWPAPTVGTGTSSMLNGLPNSWTTAAFMVLVMDTSRVLVDVFSRIAFTLLAAQLFQR